MALERVHAQADDLDVASIELRLDPRHVAQLGRADRREVLGMREENAPRAAQPFVEADRALGGRGLEVGGIAADGKWSAHVCAPRVCVIDTARELRAPPPECPHPCGRRTLPELPALSPAQSCGPLRRSRSYRRSATSVRRRPRRSVRCRPAAGSAGEAQTVGRGKRRTVADDLQRVGVRRRSSRRSPQSGRARRASVSVPLRPRPGAAPQLAGRRRRCAR